jgi:hypothetical protein
MSTMLLNLKENSELYVLICNFFMVRERGLEPPRLAALAPQASLSTDSSTRASNIILTYVGYS